MLAFLLGALVGSLGRPLGGCPHHIPHRWGCLWVSSLNLPPLLLQRYTPVVPSTLWAALSTGILSRWLQPGSLLQLSLGLKENSGSVGYPPLLLPSFLTLCSSLLQPASHPQTSLRRGSYQSLSSCVAQKSWRHLSTCQVFPSLLWRTSPRDSAALYLSSWRLRYQALREDNSNL